MGRIWNTTCVLFVYLFFLVVEIFKGFTIGQGFFVFSVTIFAITDLVNSEFWETVAQRCPAREFF